MHSCAHYSIAVGLGYVYFIYKFAKLFRHLHSSAKLFLNIEIGYYRNFLNITHAVSSLKRGDPLYVFIVYLRLDASLFYKMREIFLVAVAALNR